MKNTKKLLIRKNRAGYVFCLPFIVGLLTIFFPTILYSLWYSLCTVEIQFNNVKTTFIGFGNFINTFAGDVYFRVILTDALKGMVINTVIILIFSFFVANLLNQKFVGRSFARVVFFLPVILTGGIIMQADATNMLTTMYASGTNTTESIATAFGGGTGFALFDLERMLESINIGTGFTNTILYAVNNTYEIVSLSGVQILIFLSALQSINPSIMESAKVEGATKWEEFWKITFPMLTPMILVAAIYTIVDSFTNPKFKLLGYIEDLGINNNQIGYASAMAWVFFIIVSIIIGVVLIVSSKHIHYLD